MRIAGTTSRGVRSAALLASLVVVLGAGSARAKPGYKAQLVAYYGEYLPRGLADCAVCHLTDKQIEALDPKPEDEKPWNPYGRLLKQLGDKKRKETGKRPDIVERIKALAEADADDDGAANELELLAGYWPGDRSSRPDEKSSAQARSLRTRFLNRYDWKPFEPVTAPPVPKVADAARVYNVIDAFIIAEQEARGLKLRPPAPPEVLLRRVYLDLIGLPPTRAQLHAFLNDTAPGAYERVVESLLASPQYGERWGRHWMDIWRYADQDERRLSGGIDVAPHMWRWRDWIVESLNADKGYDVMIRRMLAGDEISPTDPDAVRATAYLARNKASNRDTWLHTTVDHAMQAFIGLSIQCARCHDHPVDPITQVEYYRLRAIFEPYQIRIDPLPGAAPAPPPPASGKRGSSGPKDGITRAFDANLSARTYLYIRGNELMPDKDQSIAPGVPALLKGPGFQVRELTVASDKGEHRSSGRRSALADWLTDPRHPLTARVAVNHIWNRRFGTGIVASVNDFGRGGAVPSHPALLDRLAAEFIAAGWKMKHLHRLMVTSAVYRQDSTPDPANRSGDPEDRHLSRFPPRRMEAELVRDSLLAVAGRLDRAMGGPSLKPEQADALTRRSLYFQNSQYTQMMFLTAFDGAPVAECYERSESIQPQQALALLNSRVARESARALARSAGRAGVDDDAFLTAVFETVLTRRPTDQERRICREYMTEQTRFLIRNKSSIKAATDDPADITRPSADPALRAREDLVHLLINHHDFVTIR